MSTPLNPDLEAYLGRIRDELQKTVQSELTVTPKTEAMMNRLKDEGIMVHLEYGCSIRLFVSETFRVPTQPVADPDSHFSDEDRAFLKGMGI